MSRQHNGYLINITDIIVFNEEPLHCSFAAKLLRPLICTLYIRLKLFKTLSILPTTVTCIVSKILYFFTRIYTKYIYVTLHSC